MAKPRFPQTKIGRQSLEFFPSPFRPPLRAFASLVIPWRGEEALLCHIVDRGWCIPSGRVELGESSREAAIREANEEAGASLADVVYLGCYRVTERQDIRWVDAYTASVLALGEISHKDESTGIKFVGRGDLPASYYAWNDLIAMVFNHAYESLARHKKLLGKP